MSPRRRQRWQPTTRDGYSPIEAYVAVGDGRTVALISDTGSVDWLAIPDMDAPPAFAAILDEERGGRFELRPVDDDFTVTRRYRPDTAVAETTFITASGTVTVVDALNRQGQHPLPWTELARLVRGDSGTVDMQWRIAPGMRFDSAEPWAHERDDVVMIRLGDQTCAVVTHETGTPEVKPHVVEGRFTATEGTESLVALVATDHEPIMVPAADQITRRVDETTRGWRDWSRLIDYDGAHADAVVRSAITLRLLTLAASGANAAAPTTSLPETLDGSKNYDYRFTWVRDASFALDMLTNLGLMPEVHSALSWLLQAVARTAPEVHVFYTLSGEPAGAETHEVETYSGYRGVQPVQIGNSAGSQRQLGAYGDLMDAVWRYVKHGGQLDPASGSMLAEMADRVCDVWRTIDAGLWELSERQHYTSSKIGCWVALDRAARMAEHGQLPAWHAARWRTVRDEIHAWVDEHCWSKAKRAYTMYAGSDKLDAAVLLAGRTGFSTGAGSRLSSTIDAIRSELGAGGALLYRYSGMQEQECAFVACSFWLIEALAYSGQEAQARTLLDDMLGRCNVTGLLSEQIDPQTGEFRGNFPQGLSHLALVGAVHAVEHPELDL